jgi:pantoate--beta-alanine ligase
MQIIRTIKDMQALSRNIRDEHKTIGFVPTMGALHEGHMSLMKRSGNENDVSIVSIFVNPKQFGPNEDFRQYPRNIEGDLTKLSSIKVDIVFFPDDKEMYPDDFSTSVNIGSVGEVLCGASRPGHFNGVATVVVKLCNIVMPHNIYLGQKDFQQTAVIKKLIKELNFDINVIVCPTVREHDGLAMSSRNIYLNHEERKAAAVLYRALKLGEELISSKGLVDALYVKNEMKNLINSGPVSNIDYVEIVTTEHLEEVEKIKSPVAICIAVRIGRTRLIDNIIVDGKQI